MRAYVNIDEMLTTERPDLVSLSLPNQGHFDATLQVIRAGYPLLVEKPLVFDLHEADVLLAEAAARGLFFALNFNHRYPRPLQMARQAVEGGRLGELVFAVWRFGGEGSSDHPHANLIETQCHAFDQLEWLCGPIDTVMAEMTDKTGGGYRTLVLALHFSSGAVGSLIGTYDSSYAYTDTHRLEINGTAGAWSWRTLSGAMPFKRQAAKRPRCGRQATLTIVTGSFTGPLTGTSTTCWARSGAAIRRRFLPRPDTVRLR